METVRTKGRRGRQARMPMKGRGGGLGGGAERLKGGGACAGRPGDRRVLHAGGPAPRKLGPLRAGGAPSWGDRSPRGPTGGPRATAGAQCPGCLYQRHLQHVPDPRALALSAPGALGFCQGLLGRVLRVLLPGSLSPTSPPIALPLLCLVLLLLLLFFRSSSCPVIPLPLRLVLLLSVLLLLLLLVLHLLKVS